MTLNDVITKNNGKTWNIYHSKGIDQSCPKMYVLFKLSQYVKAMGIFVKNLAIFTMPAHEIRSCHVIQKANFEFFS